MMSWDIRVTQSDTPRVATAASVASTVRERDRSLCGSSGRQDEEREREKRGAQVWSPGSWVGALLRLPILRPRFVISFLTCFSKRFSQVSVNPGR